MKIQKSKIVVIILIILVIVITVGVLVWMFSKQLNVLQQKSPENEASAIGSSRGVTSEMKSSEPIIPPQDSALITTATGIPAVELVRTVKVKGMITGADRDINSIQILSTGELAYEKSDFSKVKDSFVIEEGDVQSTFFIGDRVIEQKDPLTPVKEIGGKLTYIVRDDTRDKDTLIYGNDKKAPDSYFSKFEDIGGKLAYIYRKPDDQFETLVYDDKEIATSDRYFTLLKDVGGKLAYVKRSKTADPLVYKETLFYDGQEIRTFGTPQAIELVAGKLAYIVHDSVQKKDILFYDGKQVDIADSIGGLVSVDGKLIYQMQNGNGSTILVGDGKHIATSMYGFVVKEIDGKLAYSSVSANPDKTNEMSLKHNLFYDGVEVTSSNFALFLTAEYGERISDIEDVGGELAYIIEGHESEDSLYYNGKKILTAEIIGNSYQTVINGGNSYAPYTSKGTKPFYFFGADEKDGTTTFSIYRIIPN